MRKRIKRGIEFLAFLAIIALLFSGLTWLMRGNEDFSKQNVVALENQGKVDVVLYGGSNVYCFFQPLEAWDRAGFTSYNYCTSRMPLEFMVSYIRESRKANEALLYICDLRTLNLSTSEMALRNWLDSLPVFSPERIRDIASYLSNHPEEDLDALSYYFDIAKYHTNYDAFSSGSQWLYLNQSAFRKIPLNHWILSYQHMAFNPPSQVTDTRAELSPQQRKILDELLDYCDKESLPVLFTLCPYVISAEDWAIFNTCGDIIRERGYDFINFNEYYDEIGLDFETDYTDVSHTNYLGSKKYTDFLADYLAEHYDLPDHRGDEAYSAWEKQFNEYTKQQEEWRSEITERVNSDLVSAEIVERLPDIDDLATWLSLIQNEYFTVLVERDECGPVQIGDPVASGIYRQMLALWELDGDEPRCACAWSGKECLSKESEADSFEGEIGLDNAKDTVLCTVRAGEDPRIMINGADYYSGLGGIQVVVFDNNRHEVVDSVNILADESGVRLVR